MNTGYVVCAKCGARIKADREWCLRCEAPLVAARPSELPLPGWLKAWGGGTLIFGAVGVLALLLVGYTIWESRSTVSHVGVQRMRLRPASPSAGSAAATARSVTLWSATSSRREAEAAGPSPRARI